MYLVYYVGRFTVAKTVNYVSIIWLLYTIIVSFTNNKKKNQHISLFVRVHVIRIGYEVSIRVWPKGISSIFIKDFFIVISFYGFQRERLTIHVSIYRINNRRKKKFWNHVWIVKKKKKTIKYNVSISIYLNIYKTAKYHSLTSALIATPGQSARRRDLKFFGRIILIAISH